MLCDFQRDGDRWRCTVCRRRTPIDHMRPPIRQCVGEAHETHRGIETPYLDCPHRGKLISQHITGIGCGKRRVTVHYCNHHNKLVTFRPSLELQKKLENYDGTNCLLCEYLPARVEAKKDTPALAQTSVAVIITCHNYGRFLRQCLNSIITQSRPPSTIILVDDASDDDTPSIAQEYTNVRYERVEYRNASTSRNHGARIAGQPDFILNVDADNWLPSNYLAELLKGMTSPNIGVVYCRLWQVDEHGAGLKWSPAVKPFTLDALRKQNLADTCSLVRRQALEQVGGWSDNRWGLQDWDLWLRIADAGWQFVYTTKTALNYRIHPTRMSEAMRGQWKSGMEVMRDAQLTAIVTLFSGRSWNLNRWFDDLRALNWNHDNLHIVAVDNSNNPRFHRALQIQLQQCGISHTLLQDDSQILDTIPAADFSDSAKLRIEHKYRMNQHLGRLYSLASKYIPHVAANVWSIEDDVGFPPDILERLGMELYRHCTASAVSACLRNRFSDKRLVAWTGPNQWVHEAPTVSLDVTGTGLYCLLARRAAWNRIAWRPDTLSIHPYYDWAACTDLRQSGPIFLAPVRCIHWQADGTCLEV